MLVGSRLLITCYGLVLLLFIDLFVSLFLVLFLHFLKSFYTLNEN
jgi:hypothetical protein